MTKSTSEGALFTAIHRKLVDALDRDLQDHPPDEQAQIMDWLFANQLSKTSAGVRLIESWEHSPSALQRRTFWYRQARLRWTGQAPPNTEDLLDALEDRLAREAPEVQWAMNFAACQIGLHQPEHRARCVTLGERLHPQLPAALHRDPARKALNALALLPGRQHPVAPPRRLEALGSRNTPDHRGGGTVEIDLYRSL